MTIPKFSVKNTFLVNMIMIFVFIIGYISMSNLPREAMPRVDFDIALIIVNYRGVSPEEIEELITNPIEERVNELDDIDYFNSTSAEGSSKIFIQYDSGIDFDKAVSDLKSEVNSVNLPDDADDPWILKMSTKSSQHILSVALCGEYDANILREIAENLKDNIKSINDISEVDLWGIRDREIKIDIDPTKLTNYNIDLGQVIRSISNRNQNIPSGTLEFGKNDFILRTLGEFETISQINDLIVKSTSDGKLIRLKDIAKIYDSYGEIETITKLNGREGAYLHISKGEDGNIIDLVQEIKDVVLKFQKTVPNLEIEFENDLSESVKDSIGTLSSNAIFGIVLVGFLLFLFLGWRSATFAILGIPFTFLLTFITMYYMGYTFNNLSLFALVLIIGMVVDDAIVILENVYRYLEMGYSKAEAAIKGTEEVMLPVTTAVLTTVAAFLPMLMMEGIMGKFMSTFPIIISIALFASLIEAIVILPSHLADFGKINLKKKSNFQKMFTRIQEKYKIAAKFVLKHRYITLFVVLPLLFILALSLVFSGVIKMEFFPTEEADTIILQFKLPVGTKIENTDLMTSKVENYLLSDDMPDVKAVLSNVGLMIIDHRWEIKSHNAQVYINLIDEEKRIYTNDEMKNLVRKFMDKQAGITYVRFTQQDQGPPTGNAIEIRIKGDNLNKLKTVTEYVKNGVSVIPGVVDLRDSFEKGKKEVRIIPKHDKIALYNLDVSQISFIIKAAFDGIRASEFRGKGNEEYDIVVSYDKEQVRDLDDLRNLRIRTQTGVSIRLDDIAELKIEQGINSIKHRDTKRFISIQGDVIGESVDEVNKIIEEQYSNVSQKFPGYSIEFGGRREEQQKSYASLYRAFLVAILLIYMILGTQFKSWIQPFMVMFTVPFAFIGVIIGLFVNNLPFSLTTLISVVALAGVVVNDSLVLVDFVNRLRSQGMGKWHSLIEAGAVRLRPIILTTITTIGGLLPLSLSIGGEDVSWKPMAISISWGLGFATILTLFVIPCFYAVLDEIFGKLKMTRFNEHEKFSEEYKEK